VGCLTNSTSFDRVIKSLSPQLMFERLSVETSSCAQIFVI